MAPPPLTGFPSPSRLRSRHYVISSLAIVCLLGMLFYVRQNLPSLEDIYGSISGSFPSNRPEPSLTTTDQSTANNNANSSYADVALKDTWPHAVIIEMEVLPNLVPLMLHFATVLGPTWNLILYTLEDRWKVPSSPAFRRYIQEKRIEVRFLPPGTRLYDTRSVSLFFTRPWLWEQLRRARKVLLFQSDSILCANAEQKVEDFFGFDFVGAPIASQFGQGFNGGLSLRDPRLFLDITREEDFGNGGEEFEDQFFYKQARRRNASLPSESEAKTFSVETIYYQSPLGYHQPQRWQSDHMDEIKEWCPEVEMLIGRRTA